MDHDFQMLQDLVKCLSGVSISRAGIADQELMDVFFVDTPAAMRSEVSDREFMRMLRNMRSGCIYEIKSALGVCYLCIYNEEGKEYLLIGPCLLEPLTEEEIALQLRNSGLETHVQQMLGDYVRRLPAVPYETLHQLGALLASYRIGVPRPVPYQQIDYRWDLGSRKAFMLVDHYEDLGKMRQVERRYETSAAMTEAVKQGNLSLAYQLMRQINPEAVNIVRNADPLRNAQNMCIIMNTQLRHAMEDSGIHPYRLDQLSHQIALQIEKFQSAAEANKFPMEIIRYYCELARENAYPQLKPFTRLAVTYIKEHLSDNLTVKGTAKALLVNANYLSYQFHQDMGMTFIDFVNRERVNQAAALLKHTNMQIQQIAAVVGYNHTSYFAKQFLKYQKMTPRAFRADGVL